MSLGSKQIMRQADKMTSAHSDDCLFFFCRLPVPMLILCIRLFLESAGCEWAVLSHLSYSRSFQSSLTLWFTALFCHKGLTRRINGIVANKWFSVHFLFSEVCPKIYIYIYILLSLEMENFSFWLNFFPHGNVMFVKNQQFQG